MNISRSSDFSAERIDSAFFRSPTSRFGFPPQILRFAVPRAVHSPLHAVRTGASSLRSWFSLRNSTYNWQISHFVPPKKPVIPQIPQIPPEFIVKISLSQFHLKSFHPL